MNSSLLTQEIGSLRKPKWLVKTLREKSSSEEEREKAREDAALLNVVLLEKAGLDIVYDGEARRVEMYEYSAKRIKGMRFSGRVRSWDAKYYRKARCVGKVGYTGNYHLDEFNFVRDRATKMIKVPITGAYTIADWSYNEAYATKRELALDLASKVLRPLVRDLVEAGAEFIQVDEPAATTHPHEMKLVVDSFNETVREISGVKFGIHICYSGNNYEALFPEALRMKNHQYALEFANRDSWELGRRRDVRTGYKALDMFSSQNENKEIGLGVVDVHVDRVESPQLIRDRVLYAVDVVGDPSLIHVNPDCGLRTRSREIAFLKLSNLVKGVLLAKTELGLL